MRQLAVSPTFLIHYIARDGLTPPHEVRTGCGILLGWRLPDLSIEWDVPRRNPNWHVCEASEVPLGCDICRVCFRGMEADDD